jgi:ABC-type microcin C transport system permease subunit YejB
MKLNRSFVWAFVLLVLVAALYRLMPNRPLGFAPQIAMALFGGAMIKDRKWAISLPLLSMLISDILFQVLYQKLF